MHDKTVLVTGANSGIGFETALDLAKRGATTVMVCRNRSRGERARAAVVEASGNGNVDLMVCDLASQKQIRALAADFIRRHHRLHVLVNNAAVVPGRRELTEDGFEMQFAVNHLAYFLLTHLLLETLKASAPARIVNVASGMHKGARLDFQNLQAEMRYKRMAHYGVTKLLNVLFTFELARRLEGTEVTANALSPEFTATELGRNFGPISRYVMKHFAQKAAKGAETMIYLAVSPDVAAMSGRYFDKCRAVSASKAALDREAAARLWALSEKETQCC